MSIFETIGRAIGRDIGKRTAKKAVDDFISSGRFDAMVTKTIDEMIAAELRKPEYADFRFVKQMQARILHVDPTMDPKRAFETARRCYRDFLKDEKVKFGDPRFDWSWAGAHELIQAYEIDYWERTA